MNETAWAGGEGEEAVLKRGEKRVGLIRALSKLRAAVFAAKEGPKEESKLCGSCEKQGLENE